MGKLVGWRWGISLLLWAGQKMGEIVKITQNAIDTHENRRLCLIQSPSRRMATAIGYERRPDFSAYRESVASTERTKLPEVSKGTVQIVNPPRGHSGVVSRKQAERWIKQRRAFAIAGGVLLTAAFRKSMTDSIAGRTAESRGGYDSVVRPMREKEVRNLPLVQRAERTTRRPIVAGRMGPVGPARVVPGENAKA